MKKLGKIMAMAWVIGMMAWPAAAEGLDPFATDDAGSTDLQPFPKWTGALERYFDQQQLATQPCDTTRFNPCKLNEWQQFVQAQQGKSRLAQLKAVNDYLNQLEYIVDPVNWQVPDYWATPNEFLAVEGDCEDYTIAKFMSLRALGVPNEDMRIMIVQDLNLGGIIHSVLAVKLEGETYILDNQIPKVLTAEKIRHYRPVYSVNETRWWRH